MRGSTMTYTQYCGVHSSAGASGPLSDIANQGDQCGGVYMRIINPSGNLSNMLQIRGELSETPGNNSALELVVCAVSDRLLEMQ